MNLQRIMFLIALGLLAAAVALAGCSSKPIEIRGGQGQDDQGIVAPTRPAGATAFAEHCAGCHGNEGQGGSAPKIRPPRLSENEVFTVIADGRPGTQMPAFRGVLSEASVDSIIDYLFGK